MPITLQLGPFMVDSRILITIISVITGLLIIRWKTNKLGDGSKTIIDLVFNGVFIVFLCWKFGPLLFDPSIIWNRPIQLLWIMGSWKEIILGIMVATIYIIYKVKKTGVSLRLLLDVLPFGMLGAMMVKHLLWWEYGLPTRLPWGISLNHPEFKYHPIHLYGLILSVGMLIWLHRHSHQIGSGNIAQRFCLYYGIGLFVISFWQVSSMEILFFSVDQIVYTGMIALGLILPYILKRERG